MKFRTERDGLLEALVTAGRAAGSRGGGMGSPSIQLSLRANQLEVTGSDPDLVIDVRTGVVGEADGVTLVPSRLVGDIVRALEPGTVGVVADEEEVRISSGRAEFVVRVPVGAEISRLSQLEGESITLPAVRFAEGLRQVVRAALTDDSRAPQLTGVLMVATESGMRLVATDSYRLALRDLEGLSALEPGAEVLVPARALTEIQRLVGSGADDASLIFRHSELDAVFEIGEVRLTTRLLRGPFPDYQRLLPPSYPYALTTDREEFAGALRRVRLMVRDAKDATTPVRVTFSPEGAELTVLTAESGRAVERVDGRFSGDELTVAFNPSYLLEGVEAIRSETVLVQVIDASKPATLRGDGEDEYSYLLMPVRVS